MDISIKVNLYIKLGFHCVYPNVYNEHFSSFVSIASFHVHEFNKDFANSKLRVTFNKKTTWQPPNSSSVTEGYDRLVLVTTPSHVAI